MRKTAKAGIKKKRAPTDATLRNVRAAKGLMARIVARLAKLETRVAALEDAS